MRGDPTLDKELTDLYRRERRAKRRKLRWIQSIAGGFAVLAIIVMFTVDYRPIRAAGIPFALAILTLRLLDPDWLSLNQRFSIGLVVVVLGSALLRLFGGLAL